ncbi:MFS transporter [Acidianus infernus]|uniref:MFS transporter n=1 Tax=Acidianus infernus TaxID=12915 RepID=A0A6A9QCL0_ACIIN|nr:MFS transporter [Acidianus infernus]MUM64931.1 MFS transporter [Acidianus infernus]
MQKYIHAVTSSTLAWAGNIYDLVLITYAYTFLNKIVGISYLDLTIIFSLGLIGRVIGASIFGKIADTRGRKIVALTGTAGYSIFQAFFALTVSFPLMAFFRTIEGIFMGAQWTSGTVLAIEQAPKQKLQFVNSIVQAGYALGYALTGVTYIFMSSDLTSISGYRIFMLTGSLPLILVPYIYFKVTEEFKPSVVAQKVRVKDYFPYFIRASLAMSGMFIAYLAIFSIYPDFAGFSGFPAYYVGLLMAIANAIQGTSYVIFGRLSYRFGVFKLIYVGIAGLLVASFLSMPIFTPLKTLPIMSAGVYLYAFAVGFWPLISGIAASSVPPEVRAFLTGTAYNIGAVAGGIVSAMIGGIIEAFGMASLPYFVDGIEFASLAVVFVSMFTWPIRIENRA